MENRTITKQKTQSQGYTRLKNIIFFLIWLFIFGKLFIADIETFLFRTYNINESWILNYRFLLLTVIAILLWFRLGFWRFLKNAGLFLLYPFKILFWNIPIIIGYKIPTKLFKSNQYILLFGYIESIVGFFRRFRWSMLLSTLLLLSILATFNSTNLAMLYMAFAFFIVYLSVHFVNRVRYAVNPLGIAVSNAKFLENRENDTFIPKLTITEKEKDDEIAIKKKKDEHIQSIIGIKNLLSFLAKKIDTYSKFTFLFLMVIKIIVTFTLSILTCALMSYCLFKIDRANYSSSLGEAITFIDFIVYGFFNVAPDGIYIEPASRFAWVLKTIFGYIGVVCIGIFLLSAITAATSTFEPLINKIVAIMINKSANMDTYLKNEYQMTEDEAMEYLSQEDESKIEFILQIKRLNK